jgi:hypothetical protein
MMSYKDRTFCCSEVHKPDCDRQLTEEVIQAAIKWWGSEDAPIAVADFCGDNI